MAIWSAEIKELERLYESLRGNFPELEKELEQLIKFDDPNVIMLYSRRCLEIIITDLCECELKRPRKTEPLKGIIDKLHKEEKVPPHIITSMHGLNDLSTYGAHPKDFDPEQVKPVLVNLDIIIKWYLNYKETGTGIKSKLTEEIKHEIKITENGEKSITISRKRLAGLLSGSIAIIATVFAVLYFSKIIGESSSVKEIEKSIAVLPFKLLSDEPDKQYLADGMMDAITLHLSKIKDLRVLSRTSVEQYRNPTKTTTAIGRELGVGYLLEGSFQKFGDKVRLIVQLIKTGKEGHIWANDYDRNWNDIFAVQSEVAQIVAAELYASITQAEKKLIEKIPTVNMTAWDIYLKANDFQKDYEKTRDLSSYHTAVNLFKTALAIDSAFAKAYSGLAMVYYNRYYYENYFKESFLDSCLILINRALSIDNQLDEAYYIKGSYYLENENIEDALDNFDKALKINPNYYLVYNKKGYILRSRKQDFVQALGNFHKALALISGPDRPAFLRELAFTYQVVGFIDKANYYLQEAFALDCDSVENFYRLSLSEFSLGNFDEALKLTKRAYEIDSTFFPGLVYVCYSIEGHDKEAYLIANKLSEFYKKSGEPNLLFSHRFGYAFEKVGKHEEAKDFFDQQIKYCEESIKLGRDYAQNGLAYYDLAATYAFLGNKAKAYQCINDAGTMNFYPLWFINLTKHDPLFNSISNEDRFKKLLQYMEVKYQAEYERVKKWLEDQKML